MTDFYVAEGDEVRFAKTVSESDVYQFAGISGDFAPNHVNQQVMERSAYGQRIAHGALMVAYMSAASTRMLELADSLERLPGGVETAVSLGYDRMRFLKPVFFGDTVTVTYTIVEVDPDKRRSGARIEIVKQDGELVAVAQHILAWVKNR